MASIDAFRQDPFSMIAMTSAIERAPYVPDGIGAMGVFTPNPIRTTALMVEERNGVLTIIPTSERGAPVKNERTTEKRKVKAFVTPRLDDGDTITADEIQGVRAFGEETEVMQLQDEVGRRLNGPTGLVPRIRYTHEAMRLGAVQGKLVDADQSILYDWFAEFGIAEPASINFPLAAKTAGSLRPICNQLVRSTARSSKGLFTPSTKVIALCGDSFYDLFTTHPDVEKTYVNWSDAVQLRGGPGGQGAPFSAFEFGGVTWVNYRGSDDNAEIKIADDQVRFFPDCPGVFEMALAPAETFDFVNTPGKEFYAIPIFDRDRNMWWRVEVYSYPLMICKRPDVLRKGALT